MKINIYTYADYYLEDNLEIGLSHLCLLIQLDTTKRFLDIAGIGCDINVFALRNSQSQINKIKFSKKLSEQYHLLSTPSVFEIKNEDLPKGHSCDFSYIPSRWIEHTDSIPQWMNDALLFPNFIILDGEKLIVNSIQTQLTSDDLRMLMIVGGFSYEGSFENARGLVVRGNKLKYFLINKTTEKNTQKIKQSIEVLLGGFHKGVETFFNQQNLLKPFNVNSIFDIMNTFIAPILEADSEAFKKYSELDQFYNICLFALFPKYYSEMGFQKPLPIKINYALIEKWEHERIISLVVQVGRNKRGEITLTVDEALNHEKVLKLAYEIPGVDEVLGNQSITGVTYFDGGINIPRIDS